jgi:hypothetical protein
MGRKTQSQTDAPPKVRGEVVIRSLGDVKKNPWNPNVMTDTMKASLRHGLKTDGWLISQSLLIWGRDDNGDQQDMIIDGEHRWVEAQALGMKEGPMVFLDGLTKAKAKALTIKMNQKRGEFDADKLADVVVDLADALGDIDLGIELGLEEDYIAGLTQPVASEPARKKPGGFSGKVHARKAVIKYVLVFENEAQQERYFEFLQMLKRDVPGKSVAERQDKWLADNMPKDPPE